MFIFGILNCTVDEVEDVISHFLPHTLMEDSALLRVDARPFALLIVMSHPPANEQVVAAAVAPLKSVAISFVLLNRID